MVDIIDNSSSMDIQSTNKKNCLCFSESPGIEWRFIHITIKHYDGSNQVLKIQRDENKPGWGRYVTSMPGDGSGRDDEKQIYFDGSVEREYRAVGYMTLRPSEDCGGDLVFPVEAKFYVKYLNQAQHRPWRFRYAFDFILSYFSYDYQRIEQD